MPIAAAIPLITAAVGAGTAIYSARQGAKAVNQAVQSQKDIAANLKYEPIDIEALKKSATEQAIANATQSLALERSLQPDVAATREDYSRTVREDLARGGKLDVDTINQVNQAGRVIGSTSGIGSSSTIPLTAALLGISSVNLANQRKDRARDLVMNTELPQAGLDPGALATLEVQQNAAQNQFNLEKSGIDSSLAESTALARGTQIGGQTGTISSLGNLLGAGISAYLNRKKPGGIVGGLTEQNQNPVLNPIMANGTSLLA
jgi:hypothetical protein